MQRSKQESTCALRECQEVIIGICCPHRLEFEAMDPELISRVMREMGRKGGKKGGKRGAKARMESLTPEQRTEIARKAAKARWAKTKKTSKHPVKKEGR